MGDEERWAVVVILLEHQSDTDRLMPLRLILFMVLYWDRQWREWLESSQPRAPLQLRPILPIVFYTGSTAWGSARTIADLLDEPKEFHSFVPRWEPLFRNLSDRSPEELLSTAGEWLKALAVMRAADAEPTAFAEVFEKAVKGIAGLVSQDEVRWHDLMRLLLTWIYWRRPAEEREQLETIAVASQREQSIQTEVGTMASKLGPSTVEKSFNEGALQNARSMLLAMIERKFKSVPESLARQIDSCIEVEKLTAATISAASAERADEITL